MIDDLLDFHDVITEQAISEIEESEVMNAK